jgi:hypothetical protein
MKASYPKLPSTKGKHGQSVMPPDGRVVKYVVKDEVRAFQDSSKSKVLLLQLMLFEDGQQEVRIGYYIIGKLPKMKDKWVWGQFAAFMPLRIFQRLIQQATKKGWFNGSATAPVSRAPRSTSKRPSASA